MPEQKTTTYISREVSKIKRRAEDAIHLFNKIAKSSTNQELPKLKKEIYNIMDQCDKMIAEDTRHAEREEKKRKDREEHERKNPPGQDKDKGKGKDS